MQLHGKAFTERFDNTLAGWAVTFDAGTKDEMTFC